MILNFFIVLVLVLIDQLSKFLVIANIKTNSTLPVVKDFFHLTYVENRGVAFGMFYGHVSILTIISVVAIISIILYMHKMEAEHSFYSRFGFLFILAGAIGNFIDRFFRGYVVDFIDFRGIWPYIFNMADVFINIGVFLIILEYFIEKESI